MFLLILQHPKMSRENEISQNPDSGSLFGETSSFSV